MIKTVTKQQMAEFIMEQPDDREVEFRESIAVSDCGCIMIQYAEHNVPWTKYCGLYKFKGENGETLAYLGTEYFTFWPGASMSNFPEKSRFTYGELKNHVRSLGLV
jgi:hypothetical protein